MSTERHAPHVSVIVATWNRCDELRDCLRSVAAQNCPGLEVLVVDDGSTDNTRDMIAREFPDVRVIGDGARFGHCYRRNQGIMESRGEFVLILDSDVELVRPGTIGRMADILSSDPKVGEIGGEMVVSAGERDEAFGKGISPSGYSFRAGSRRGECKPVECSYLAGCNFMMRRTVAIEAGGFDPYYVFGLEDMDFGLVLQEMGYRNYVLFECAVDHKGSSSGRRNDEDACYQRSRVRFLIKHKGVMRTIVQFLWDQSMIAVRRMRSRDASLREVQRVVLHAYVEGLRGARTIIGDRGRNFLTHEEMARYRLWATGSYS